MLALTNDHGDHSFLLINNNNTNSGHASRLLVERAFFNDPKERAGGHPFFVRMGEVDTTGTMTITVVPRPGAVWISNLPPISDAR